MKTKCSDCGKKCPTVRCPDCRKKARARYTKNGGWLYETLRRTRRDKRALDNNLTIEHLREVFKSQNGLCAITGLEMTIDKGSHNTASLDRIEAGEGYLIGNVMFTCQWVNLARNSRSITQFREEVLDKLAAHYSKVAGMVPAT